MELKAAIPGVGKDFLKCSEVKELKAALTAYRNHVNQMKDAIKKRQKAEMQVALNAQAKKNAPIAPVRTESKLASFEKIRSDDQF